MSVESRETESWKKSPVILNNMVKLSSDEVYTLLPWWTIEIFQETLETENLDKIRYLLTFFRNKIDREKPRTIDEFFRVENIFTTYFTTHRINKFRPFAWYLGNDDAKKSKLSEDVNDVTLLLNSYIEIFRSFRTPQHKKKLFLYSKKKYGDLIADSELKECIWKLCKKNNISLENLKLLHKINSYYTDNKEIKKIYYEYIPFLWKNEKSDEFRQEMYSKMHVYWDRAWKEVLKRTSERRLWAEKNGMSIEEYIQYELQSYWNSNSPQQMRELCKWICTNFTSLQKQYGTMNLNVKIDSLSYSWDSPEAYTNFVLDYTRKIDPAMADIYEKTMDKTTKKSWTACNVPLRKFPRVSLHTPMLSKEPTISELLTEWHEWFSGHCWDMIDNGLTKPNTYMQSFDIWERDLTIGEMCANFGELYMIHYLDKRENKGQISAYIAYYLQKLFNTVSTTAPKLEFWMKLQADESIFSVEEVKNLYINIQKKYAHVPEGQENNKSLNGVLDPYLFESVWYQPNHILWRLLWAITLFTYMDNNGNVDFDKILELYAKARKWSYTLPDFIQTMWIEFDLNSIWEILSELAKNIKKYMEKVLSKNKE